VVIAATVAAVVVVVVVAALTVVTINKRSGPPSVFSLAGMVHRVLKSQSLLHAK